MFDFSALHSQIRSARRQEGGACPQAHDTMAGTPQSAPPCLYYGAFGASPPSPRCGARKHTPPLRVRPERARMAASHHRTAQTVHLPRVRPNITHPHKDPNTGPEPSLWGLAAGDTADEHHCHFTHPGRAVLVRLHHPSHHRRPPIPLPSVLTFQEHWARKLGHALPSPVCQNNSGVWNLPGPHAAAQVLSRSVAQRRSDLHVLRVPRSLLLRDESRLDI